MKFEINNVCFTFSYLISSNEKNLWHLIIIKNTFLWNWLRYMVKLNFREDYKWKKETTFKRLSYPVIVFSVHNIQAGVAIIVSIKNQQQALSDQIDKNQIKNK